jgi:hypothetical protein
MVIQKNLTPKIPDPTQKNENIKKNFFFLNLFNKEFYLQ